MKNNLQYNNKKFGKVREVRTVSNTSTRVLDDKKTCGRIKEFAFTREVIYR